MSTSAQIQAVRKVEQRFPPDVVNNGRQYAMGYKVNSETIRKLRDIRRAGKRSETT
jgi:hypothetical protein